MGTTVDVVEFDFPPNVHVLTPSSVRVGVVRGEKNEGTILLSLSLPHTVIRPP